MYLFTIYLHWEIIYEIDISSSLDTYQFKAIKKFERHLTIAFARKSYNRPSDWIRMFAMYRFAWMVRLLRVMDSVIY